MEIGSVRVRKLICTYMEFSKWVGNALEINESEHSEVGYCLFNTRDYKTCFLKLFYSSTIVSKLQFPLNILMIVRTNLKHHIWSTTIFEVVVSTAYNSTLSKTGSICNYTKYIIIIVVVILFRFEYFQIYKYSLSQIIAFVNGSQLCQSILTFYP